MRPYGTNWNEPGETPRVVGNPPDLIVRDWLWHSACREMDPIWVPDKPARQVNPDCWSHVPKILVQAVVDFLSVDLMCDHQVNICMCNAKGIVEELLLAMDGKETCRTCSGEGWTWNRDRYEAAKLEWQATEPNNQYDMPDDYGYDPCPTCAKSGKVASGFDYGGSEAREGCQGVEI